MNAGEDYRPWFEKYPPLLKAQTDILKSAGFELDSEILTKEHRIQFSGYSKADPKRKLFVKFSAAFPSAAPRIFDDQSSDLLTRHHRSACRQLCLFGFNENRWNAELSVADALKEAEELIEKFKSETNTQDGQPPEPVTLSVIYAQEAAILIPPPISTFADFAQLKSSTGKFSGKFAYEGDVKKGPVKGRGIILEAIFGANKIKCTHPFFNHIGNHGREIHGDWFYIDKSPTQKEIPDILKTYYQKCRASKKVDHYWIALIFREESQTSSQSRLTWLVYRAKQEGADLIRTFPYIQQERSARIPGLEGLEGKRITLVGCGSLGSKIAANLAASGLNRINLVDFDYFEPNNSVRHELGVECFGLYKDKALLNRLCSLNPSVVENGKCFTFQVASIAPFNIEQHFYNFVKESDLIIDTTAIHSVSHFINEIAFEFQIPALFATVTNGAWGGEIVRTIPGKTPCWVCWLDQYYDNKPPSAPDLTAEIFAPGCDQPTFTGTIYELGMVANLATSMAVDTLLGTKDFSKNYIMWSGKDKTGQPIFLTEILTINHQKECFLCGSRNEI